MPFFFSLTLIALRGANETPCFPPFSPLLAAEDLHFLVEPFYASRVCVSLIRWSSMWEKKKSHDKQCLFILIYLRVFTHLITQ